MVYECTSNVRILYISACGQVLDTNPGFSRPRDYTCATDASAGPTTPGRRDVGRPVAGMHDARFAARGALSGRVSPHQPQPVLDQGAARFAASHA